MNNRERDEKIKSLKEVVLHGFDHMDRYEALEELLKIYYDWGHSQGGFDAIAE